MITVYSKPRCMPCKQTIDSLLSEGLSFKVKPVTPEVGVALHSALGYREAPIITVERYDIQEGGPLLQDSWSGFRPDKIKELARSNDGDSQ